MHSVKSGVVILYLWKNFIVESEVIREMTVIAKILYCPTVHLYFAYFLLMFNEFLWSDVNIWLQSNLYFLEIKRVQLCWFCMLNCVIIFSARTDYQEHLPWSAACVSVTVLTKT